MRLQNLHFVYIVLDMSVHSHKMERQIQDYTYVAYQIFFIKVLLLIKFVHMFDQKGLENCTCYQFLGYCLVKGVK